MSVPGGHGVNGMQSFILSHFLNANATFYCGHKGEAYSGRIVDCTDGVVTLEKDGQRTYIACDKIESMRTT